MTELNLKRVSDVEVEEAGEAALDEIRGLFARAEEEKRLALTLPGKIGKHVKVRYRPRDDFEQVEGRSNLDTSLDYLIWLCDGILIRTEQAWKPLTQDGELVLFYPTALRELLGVNVRSHEDGGTAREAVLALFVGAPIPSEAVGDHVLRLSRWMRTGEARVDEEELLGES